MCDGGNLEAELAYGNRPSVIAHRDEITDTLISDVVLGRALAFDVKYIREILDLRVSPLGVVEEPRFRIIHDLTFAAGATVRSSVNDDTYFTQAQECGLGHVLHDIISRVLYLRKLHGVELNIFIRRVDVKDAFRQMLVDPAGAPAFGYTMGDVVVVDLRCQFGWRSSPGFWSLFSSALEHAYTHTAFQNASILPEGTAAVQLVKLVPPQDGSPAVPLPHDCQHIIGAAGSPVPRFSSDITWTTGCWLNH